MNTGRFWVTIGLLAAMCAPAAGQEALQHELAQRAKEIRELKARVAELEEEVARLEAENAELRAELEAAGEDQPGAADTADDPDVLDAFAKASTVGARARVGTVTVVQVQPDSAAIVTLRLSDKETTNFYDPAGNLRWNTEPATQDFWLSGVDLSSAVDGGRLELNMVLEITGTHTYETAAGTNRTIYKVAPYTGADADNEGENSD